MGALDGKVAIVTGAGQGLGRCHAERLAAEGAAVMVNDVGEAADEVAETLRATGAVALSQRCSVSDWGGVEHLVRRTVDELGDLHILVNNAGVLRDAMSFTMDEAQWDTVIDVHLKGHFVPSHFAAAYWRDQAKAGVAAGRRIINTTSESGLFGGPAQANYAAAKGGIISLTWVLARELERYGATANVIAPRARTSMTASIPMFAPPEHGFDKYAPEHVSPFVAWLASEAAADVNGQVFVVIGGKAWLVRPFELVGEIDTGDRSWTVEELVAAKGRLFGGRSPGVPAFAGPSM